MKLICNIAKENSTFLLHSPILLEKGIVLEYGDDEYLVKSLDKVEFDTDGYLESAVLTVDRIN